MPPFEGEGGKKRKQNRRPTTSSSICLSKSLRLKKEHVLSSALAICSEDLTHLQSSSSTTEDTFYPLADSPDCDFNVGDEPTEDQQHLPNPQVQLLADYLRTESYRRKKLLEEELWEAVYRKMFKWFHQCAAKTSNWGDQLCWDNTVWMPKSLIKSCGPC
ncbi:uncharacterized protein PGTG_22532 [Puccinia graminis f. sp. tritici CRL 75-36-700-3]|uniref:Uncharacterized protein n=1 Tax=Puccinia graminis f. sp. tritici (strain CRL 75-36-700-3 / race SCCL) TaxID=418459 RepID=H6QUW1_PUCGT|nr:uncharacterized protein PGTG_22532 [Puccinia graminis f. sp. tritici CRL 75-36-700-3]EHS64869.1 hypothetical protein PGTG_22532 [Puccinia graminis f. sp. tritici CRL 75-36-700-3]